MRFLSVFDPRLVRLTNEDRAIFANVSTRMAGPYPQFSLSEREVLDSHSYFAMLILDANI